MKKIVRLCNTESNKICLSVETGRHQTLKKFGE